MNYKENTAKHHANVLLAIHGQKVEVEEIKRKLANFYKIDIDGIISSSSQTITVFYIAAANDPLGIKWCYEDDVTFSASAYPIIDSEILKSKGGKTLRTFIRNGAGTLPEMWKVLPPLCYFHHNKQKDSLVCFNDFLGFGRLYSYIDAQVSIFASSPLPIALIMPNHPQAEDKFWNAYHMFGHGCGNYSYIKGIQLVDPGTKVTIANGKTVQVALYSYQKLLNLKHDLDPALEYSSTQSLISTIEAIKPYLNHEQVLEDTSKSLPVSIEAGNESSLFSKDGSPKETRILASKDFIVDDSVDSQSEIGVSSLEDKVVTSICERALDWFKYSSGDCCASLIRHKLNNTIYQDDSVIVSPVGGEMSEGADYINADFNGSNIASMIAWYKDTCELIPDDMKENAINLYKSELFTPLNSGIEGFHLLDYAYAMNQMRRQLPAGLINPVIGTGTITPFFNAQIALDSFWKNTRGQLDSDVNMNFYRQLFNKANITLFEHQNNISSDCDKTDKNVSPRNFYGTDKNDFFSMIERVIARFPELEIDMSLVKKTVENMNNGNERAAQILESLFWRFSAATVLEEIIAIRSNS